ncbi:MAG: response regulator transcription factor [Cyclobacteriaceae bacterium]
MAKILLAEDDENLGFMVQDNLAALDHEVVWVKNGEDALTRFQTSGAEICLIDVMMPKMDGFMLAEKIRSFDEFIPIIFLTARSQEADRLKGFEIGGDDYITKPFSIKELAYRIEVFLRRKIESKNSEGRKITLGISTYDPVNLTYTTGSDVCSLTQMEGQLLSLLLENKNRLVKREDILEKIWGENDYFKGRSLDVFITRLRKYLKADPSLEIKNHHGVGFSLVINNS